MKRLALSIIAAVFALSLFAADLGKDFALAENWKLPMAEFMSRYQASGFRFVSNSLDMAASLKRQGNKAYFGMNVDEARAYFDGDELKRLELSIWNKGDGSPMSYALMQKLVARIEDELSKDGEKPSAHDYEPSRGFLQRTKTWSASTPKTTLTWAMRKLGGGKFEPEYIKVVMTLKEEKKARNLAERSKGLSDIKANVVKTPDGDVYLKQVPMVDQGQKGYCAAAVVERVLRYYGIDVDEHEIAQLAGTSAEGGTKSEKTEEVVEKIGSRYGLGKIVDVEFPNSVKAILKEVDEYNKVAKKMKRSPIDIRSCYNGNVLMLSRITEAQESDVLKAARHKNTARFKRFQRMVRQNIDQGIPVFWGVTLGLYPESGMTPQTRGGHMRLIIGYNDKTKEILFTDTWGMGHELKRIDEENAWPMSHSLFHLKPRK